MLKWLLKSLLILAVFVPFATALPVASVGCAARRTALSFSSGRAVELLLLGADLFATQRRAVAAGTGRRASVARGERRAAAHQHPSHGLDVRCVDLFSYVAEFMMLFLFVPRRPPGRFFRSSPTRPWRSHGLEEAAWMISRAAR